MNATRPVFLLPFLCLAAFVQASDVKDVSRVFGPEAQKKMSREEATAADEFFKAVTSMIPEDRSIVFRVLKNTRPTPQELVGPVPPRPKPEPKPRPQPAPNCQVPNPRAELVGPLPTCVSLVSTMLDETGITSRYPTLKSVLVEHKAALEKVIGRAQWSQATEDDHPEK